MAMREKEELSLRLDRRELTRLAWALGLSLALHLLCYGGYELGKKAGLWQAMHWPAWLQKHKTAEELAREKQAALPTEVPLMFVDVSPQAETAEAPKNAQYYSSRNAKAANQETDQDSNIPKISGNQTQVIKTEDTPRSRFDKLQPDFQKADREQPVEEAKPKPTPGDLAMMKPDTALRPEKGTSEQSKPRTIVGAKMRRSNQLAGQQMKQEGGARRAHVESFDTKATPFGVYDAALFQAIQQRWFDLLDDYGYTFNRSGKVIVRFHLNYDGRITDMKVLETTVGEMFSLLCQKAVLDPAPYEKWPTNMRLEVGRDYRELTLSFNYQ
jgi:outer membrane biosynthesis protein TonB